MRAVRKTQAHWSPNIPPTLSAPPAYCFCNTNITKIGILRSPQRRVCTLRSAWCWRNQKGPLFLSWDMRLEAEMRADWSMRWSLKTWSHTHWCLICGCYTGSLTKGSSIFVSKSNLACSWKDAGAGCNFQDTPRSTAAKNHLMYIMWVNGNARNNLTNK